MALLKRGSSLCQGCGNSNGNRAFQCKICGCPLLKKAKISSQETGAAKEIQFSTNVSSLLSEGILPPGSHLYSIRIRDQGPDYRCFVSCVHGEWKCHYSECTLEADGRRRSGSDSIQARNACQHVKAAISSQENNTAHSHGIHLCRSMLQKAPFPPTVLAEFEAHLINGRTALAQRVSNRSFVIATTPTSEAPFGLLHIRVNSANTFQCTCNKYKRVVSLAGATTAPKLSKRCTHFYLFLWAILSHESLQKEFSLSFGVSASDSVESETNPNLNSQDLEGTITTESHNTLGALDRMQVNERHHHVSTLSHTEVTKELTTTMSRSVSVRVIQSTERIPENPDDPVLKEVLQNIKIKDANSILSNQQNCSPDEAMTWASEYAPEDVCCNICKQELPSKTRLPGTRGRAWLLSKQGFQEVTVFVKTCQNQQCLQARHNFREWKTGLLNVSNKLLISLDILLEMREHIKRGEPPGNTASAVLLAHLDLPSAPKMTPGETRYLVEKLYDGYFAFEVLTQRDWNAAICGICGVAPLFESGDGNAKNCTPLSSATIQWPSPVEMENTTGEVDIDGWWQYLEEKMLEGIIFKDIELERVKVADMAPWIPPACRGHTVNTEHLKCTSYNNQKSPNPVGCPKTLASLICQGVYDPLDLGAASISKLKEICALVSIPRDLATTKPQMIKHLEALHSFLFQGQSECHVFEAVPRCSGGKVFKNCQHQVISGSKFIMRKESTRDHVDLLLSSKYWPLAYAVDMACDVVAHMEVRVPQLAKAMWGNRRGCFETPKKQECPKITEIPELEPKNQTIIATKEHSALIHDHTYVSTSIQHPLTYSTDRYIVGDRFHDGPKTSGHKKETCRYHHMNLCPQLKTYKSVTSEVINSKIKATRLQSSNQQNIFHYFIYNRLMDYFHNIGIVQKQHSTLSSRAQCGEKVVRDSLYRFVYKKC